MTTDSPVASAVVTGRLGVLIGRRVDGRPRWAFIGGKIEAGETAADAAVREVLEETGLAVDAVTPELGWRVHPANGRLMVYVACRSSGGSHVRPCDSSLAEVRWVSLAEAQALMPGLFGPVLGYLRQELTL